MNIYFEQIKQELKEHDKQRKLIKKRLQAVCTHENKVYKIKNLAYNLNINSAVWDIPPNIYCKDCGLKLK